MDYPRYEALGLPIGSGEVEAQCKPLVQSRCKQTGMRWHSGGVEALLRVIVLFVIVGEEESRKSPPPS